LYEKPDKLIVPDAINRDLQLITHAIKLIVADLAQISRAQPPD